MKYFVLFLVALVAVSVQPANAAELRYTEFGTLLTSQALQIEGLENPSQRFRPLNDVVSGVDFWLDNSGAAGTMTVHLKRVSDDQLLASKSITISNTSPTWGGQRIHAKFNSAIPVVSTSSYKLDIVTSMPKLRLYYSSLVDVQQHDSDYTLSPSVLPAYLGSEEQDFAFKFALYEDNDTADPVISSVDATVLSPTKTEISFHANEPVDYRVLFAPSGQSLTSGTSFLGFYVQCSTLLNPCLATITTEPDTAYSYSIIAKDEWGNESSSGGTFASLEGSSENGPPDEDQAPPVELSISNARVMSVNSNSAAFAWTTNLAANSSILISRQIGNDFNAIAGAYDNTYELEHSLGTGPVLNANTQYLAGLISHDTHGAPVEYQLSFKTAEVETAPPPEEEGEEESPAATGTTSTDETQQTTEEAGQITVTINTSGDTVVASLGWSVPVGGAPSDGYRIDIFDSENNLKHSLTSATNQIDIEGLEPGDYKAVVYSNNGGMYEKIGDPIFFSIPGLDKPFTQRFRIIFLVIAAVISAAISIALLRIRKKRFAKERRKQVKKNAGLTLVEIIISIGIMVAGIALIGLFARDVSDIGIDFTQRFKAEQEVRLTINEMIIELRSITQSHEGSYPIYAASTSTLTFYTDTKNDGLIDRVRYFLDQQTLKKGTIVPSGDPLTYNPANETIKDVVHNIVAGTSTIFSYYDENFTGTEDPMAYPVAVSDIRMLEINISAKDTGQIAPISFSARITPRNLRGD